MKKLLKIITGVTLSLAMAIGVGIGVANNIKKAEPVYADGNVELAYNTATTTNMDGTNQATVLGMSSTDWSVVGAKGSAANNVGLNKAKNIRLYYHADGGNTLTVTSLQNWTITTISISFVSEDYNNASITPGTGSNSGTTGSWTINSTSFVVGNGNTSNIQVQIKSITINYSTGGGDPEPTTYTVTYNANGGTGTMTDAGSPYTSGATVTVLANSFTRDGYTFNHWNTAIDDSGSSYSAGSTFTISANTTLYAQWSEADRTVTYNSNGATGGSVPTDATVYANGATVTVLGNTGSLVKTGYIWSGWNTKADGTGISYIAGSTFSISKATSLYARWIYAYSNETAAIITADYLNLNSTGISEMATLTADDGMQYIAAPGGANSVKSTAISGSSSNKFNSESPILMGKNGAYIYNKDAFAKTIYKIEVFANHGASTAVAVAVAFDDDAPCSSSYATGSQTLNPYNAVYTFNPSVDNAKYFRIQVTNANNAQVQIKVYFDIPTTSVTVSPTSVTLNPTDTQQLTTTVLPANNTDSLSYSSSATNVATVSNDGLITAKAVGTATITATSGGFSATCVVTVELPADPYITPDEDAISGFTGQNTSIDFIYGNLSGDLGISTNNSNVTASIQNDDGAGNAEVAISFNTAGSSVISLKDGSTTLATISVTITASTMTITGLAASDSVYIDDTLDLGSTITVTATGIYTDAVTWSSEDWGIATVSAAGVVTGVAAGTVDITVTSNSLPSVSQTCSVTVSRDDRWDTEFATTMVADIDLPDGGEDTDDPYYVVAQITAITNTTYGNGNAVDKDGTPFAIYGMYNYNGTVAYNSMIVDEKPVVGDFVVLYGVFCEYKSAPEIKSARVVQRNGVVFQAEPLTGVSLNKSSLLLGVGDDFDLEASAVPNNAELGDVVWTSSNGSIASVSNGTVTGVAAGSATITATAGGFTATCEVTVSLKGVLEYTAGSTTNMGASGNASTLGLNSSLFSVDSDKGKTANYPGLNKDNDIRLYYDSTGDGTSFTVSIDNDYTITTVIIDFKSNAAKASVYAGSTVVSGSAEYAYDINDSSFKVKNTSTTSGTVQINSIEIFYRAATAKEKTSRLDTQYLLGYHYSKVDENPFEFSNVTLRLSGFISVDLWNALDAECDIEGFGIMFAETDNLTDVSIKEWYEYALDEANGDIDDAIESLDSFIGNSYVELSPSKANPSSATTLQKADLGVGAGENYFIWNHKELISAEDLDKEFSAIAYIRIDGELIFLQETTMSAKQAAINLLASGIYDNDAFDGSLDALSKWTHD